jgi:transcription initiation factor TFIID TATA-box-binding protein
LKWRERLPGQSSFRPDLIYRGDAGTALLFSSGKVILAGFKDPGAMEAFASGLKAKIKNAV